MAADAAPQAADEPPAAARREAPGPTAAWPGWMSGGMPTEKSLDFKGSGKRLLALMRPERCHRLADVFGIASVTLSVLGPKILGHATDLIFAGVIGRRCPPA